MDDIIFEIVRYSESKKDLMLVSKTWFNVIISRFIGRFWYLISGFYLYGGSKIPSYIRNVEVRSTPVIYSSVHMNNNWGNIKACNSDLFCNEQCEELIISCDCGGHTADLVIINKSSFKGLKRLKYRNHVVFYSCHSGARALYKILKSDHNLQHLEIDSKIDPTRILRYGFSILNSNSEYICYTRN